MSTVKDRDAATRTGGELLVASLRRWGVGVLFGLPGVQLDGLFDALAGDGTIRVVHTRHEQATSYMADGYARATGRVGVCAVVPGPGVLNAGAGLSTAYASNSPVLCIAGQLFGGLPAEGRGALHEIPDQAAVLAGVIGWTARARRPEDVPGVVDAAFARLTGSGRRRPAAIEVDPAVLLGTTTSVPVEPAPPSPPVPAPLAPDAGAIEEAAGRLADRRRPLIWAGGGAMDAGRGLAALAAALGAPVALSMSARGALADDRPFVLPPAGGFSLLGQSDAVVVVGSRFYGALGPIPAPPAAVVIRIDVDALELAAGPPGATNVLGDAGESCAALAEALASVRPLGTERAAASAARVAELKTAIARGLAERYPETAALCGALRAAMDPDAILVDEMTQVAYFARNGFPLHAPRTYLGPGYQGTLGFGYATALGAKVGRPDRTVVSINGDGGFMYNVAELATAVQHGINVVAVVFDDGAYGNVKGIQARQYGREIASTLRNPDFVALARSFGVEGYAAVGPDDLRNALRTAIAADRPALIHVPVGPQPDMWAILGGRTILG